MQAIDYTRDGPLIALHCIYPVGGEVQRTNDYANLLDSPGLRVRVVVNLSR